MWPRLAFAIAYNTSTHARLMIACMCVTIMATPSRSVVLSPVRRSPRLLHRQLAGSKRHSSDTDHPGDHQAPPPKAPRVSSQSVSLDYLLNSVNSDLVIASKLQLTRCTDDSGCKQLLVVSSKRLHRHEPAGFVSRLRIVVSEDQTYQLQVNLPVTKITYCNSINGHRT